MIYPKDHHFDALCVGDIPEGGYKNANQKCLCAEAKGRGNRLRGNINNCGIITVKYEHREKVVKGFQSGDIVRANVPKGKHKGRHNSLEFFMDASSQCGYRFRNK